MKTGTLLSDTRLPLGFILVQKGVMYLYTNAAIKTQADSSGKPTLRKYISVKFILQSGIVVCFIIQLLSKLRIRETNFLWKIFLNWEHFLLQTCVIDSFLLWRISIEEN